MKCKLLLLLCLITTITYAQPGTLDPFFGDGGKVIVQSSTPDKFISDAAAVILQPDGKILTAGSGNNPDAAFLVTRHNTDGSLDHTFGEDGVVYINPYPNNPILYRYAYATDIAVTHEGKILITGPNTAGQTTSTVVRLNADGALDNTFGENGIVNLQLAPDGYYESFFGISIQPDNKIVLTGAAPYGPSGTTVMNIVRLTQDGVLDKTFNGAGVAFVDFPGSFSRGQKVKIDQHNKIVAIGNITSTNGLDTHDIVIARFNADGTPDNSFGTDGQALFHFDDYNEVYDFSFHADGKLIFQGQSFNWSAPNSKNLVVVSLNADGSLNTAFDSDGIKRIYLAENQAFYSTSVQPNGRILLAGYIVEYSDVAGRYVQQFRILRLNADGSFDTTFDGDGIAEINFKSYGECHAVTLQADGKIIAVGAADDGQESGRALIRLLGDGSSCYFGNGTPFITVTISQKQVFHKGLVPMTIYTGYGPTSVINVQAVASYTSTTSVHSAFKYSWTAGTGLSILPGTADQQEVQVTASKPGNYSATLKVIVADQNGCSSEREVVINVVDASCGDKVLICRVGTPAAPTICVSPNAVPAQLNNGGILGSCQPNNKGANLRTVVGQDVTETNNENVSMLVWPNPTATHFSIVLNGKSTGENIIFRVLDVNGRIIEEKSINAAGGRFLIGQHYRAGLYIAEVVQGKTRQQIKLVKQ